jgi:putative transposase
MATVTQAYRFALDPTPIQRRALASHCGAARVAHNWGLALVKTHLDQHRTDPQVQVPWTLPELRGEWNRAKNEVAPWWPENSKEAYSSGLDGLARALRNWSDSRSGRRKGRLIGFPQFKKKGRCRDACRFTTGAIKVLPDRKHIQLPRIGVVKTHESTRKLARRLEQGTARILAATISQTADRWFVSFTVEVERQIPATNGKMTAIGVDVGIRHLAVLSTGEPPMASLPSRTHELWNDPPESFAGSTGSWLVDVQPLDDGSWPGDGWPTRTPGPPISAATPCTSSPPPSPTSTPRWWWSTSTSLE